MKSMKMETRHMAEYYKVKDIACRDTVIWSNGRFFKIYLYHVVGRDLVFSKKIYENICTFTGFPQDDSMYQKKLSYRKQIARQLSCVHNTSRA